MVVSLWFCTALVWALLGTMVSCGSGEDVAADPSWYNPEVTGVFNDFLDRKVSIYEKQGLGPEAVAAAMRLGSCASCDLRETRWNHHFQIINKTVYGVGGYGIFWNDHHRKRVKAVVTILSQLMLRAQDAEVTDVEFVINMHDYNKLLRHPNSTLRWGTHNKEGKEKIGEKTEGKKKEAAAQKEAKNVGGMREGAGVAATTLEALDMEEEGEAGYGFGGEYFDEHLAPWPGYDWALHYRIYGNHFGNTVLSPPTVANPINVAIFSATSCAFSYDISFPTTFYDFDTMDSELEVIYNKSSALFPWHSKVETAFFRGSCWYYKKHGRTSAFTMSAVAPSLLDVAWYDRVETEMLDKDGLPHFGEIFESGRYKYLLHLEGHDLWSMRIRYLSHIRSLLLKQELPCHEFYYGLFEAYVHYVPLRRDLADLYHKVLWARRHDREAEAMSARLVERARRTITQDTVLQYVHMLLQRYSKVLRYKVRLHKDARPLDPQSACLSTLVPCTF